MAARRTDRGLPLPSPAQIALALATLRSKPPHMSIEDHLQNIKRSIITVPASHTATVKKYIDKSIFWRNAFQTSEALATALQDEVDVLRHELDNQLEPGTGTRKRKAETQPVNKVNSNSKRRRAELDDDGSPSVESGENDLNFTHPGKLTSKSLHLADESVAIRTTLRAISRLQRPSKSNRTKPHEFAQTVSEACRGLVDSIEATEVGSARHVNPNSKSPMNWADLNQQLPTSYKLLLAAIDAIADRETRTLAAAQLVGGAIDIFQTTLGRLHMLVLDELTRMEAEEASKRRKPKSNMKASKTPDQEKRNFTGLATTLVHILRQLFTALDPTKPIHCQLFKALFTALLDHVGSALSTLVFADPEQSKANNGLAEPVGLKHVSHLDTTAAIAAGELEAPYLITILKFTLAFLKRNESSMPVRARELLTGARGAMDNTLLHQKVQRRLQDTLLRGVFGDEDEGFREAFTREPSPAEEEMVVDEVLGEAEEEDDKAQWFIRQVWELLGWDVLSGKMGGRS